MYSKLSTFPLLRLPKDVNTKVISNMDIIEFIDLSILSKRAKDLVRSSNRKCTDFSVALGQECEGLIEFPTHQSDFDFYSTNDEEDNFLKFDGLRIDGHQWRTKIVQNFTMKSWLNHLLCIFHCNQICLRIANSTADIELIRALLNWIKLDCLILEEGIGREYAEKILQHLPYTNVFINHVRIGHKEFSKINIQHMWSFHLEENQDVSLNDLLLNNSKILEIRKASLTPRALNRFLKLWTNNQTNPNLQWIIITSLVNIDLYDSKRVKNEVMDGIPHQIVTIQELKQSHALYNEFRDVPRTDGLMIHRKDGTKAAVHLNGFNWFQMIRLN
ncbi:hypothetical protein CAEBREN_11720 [Caenorhabditis brenneri]|uniref:F-box domain-containing protein n=1 Tax=Caenorhabditis brenneri TaxID=135651 RepID=G0MAP6_CAEBE|nr:hypothetical protein CAEBREN_11720 [Caenorhabditis brenneri]